MPRSPGGTGTFVRGGWSPCRYPDCRCSSPASLVLPRTRPGAYAQVPYTASTTGTFTYAVGCYAGNQGTTAEAKVSVSAAGNTTSGGGGGGSFDTGGLLALLSLGLLRLRHSHGPRTRSGVSGR
jgi:hypothetical protein